MKKVLYFLAAALVAVAACSKPEEEKPDPTPDPTPTVPDLTLTTDKIVDVDAESSIYTVKFGAGKAWTASLSYPDGSESGAVLDKSKGDAAEAVDLRVTFDGLPEGKIGRLVQLDLKAGSKTESILFFQGLVFFTKADNPAAFETAGGDLKVNILTNMDVTVKKYDGADEAFPWAPVTITEDKAAHTIDLAFKVAANGGYDPRQAYVKFTLPQIQDPVMDDEGNPTGETKDHVERFYLEQKGHSAQLWQTFLPEGFYVGDGATASVAVFDGRLLVSDSQSVHIVNPATGAFEGTLATGDLPVQCIANDDAGNVLFANLGAYLGLYDVYAVKATDKALAEPVHLIHFVNEAWNASTGIDKVAAKGDVFGAGVVTAVSGGVISSGGLTYTLYWTIADGKAAESYYNEWNPVVNNPESGWLTGPADQADDLWLSNRAAFVPAGSSAADGFFFGGYDGLYNVNYYDGSNWSVCVEGAGDWAGGPQGMHVTTWNGKTILVVAQMGYVWFSEGWGMPAYLWVVDVTDPANPTVLSKAEYNNGLAQTVCGDTENSTVDVLPVVDGDDLVVYYVDSSQGHVVKVRFPKL